MDHFEPPFRDSSIADADSRPDEADAESHGCLSSADPGPEFAAFAFADVVLVPHAELVIFGEGELLGELGVVEPEELRKGHRCESRDRPS